MVTYTPKPSGYSYAIQTSEGYLGILMSSQGEDLSELLVWEWRTGTLRLVCLSHLLRAFIGSPVLTPLLLISTSADPNYPPSRS